ncbi:MAG: ATP-binding cassette domain-containing protein, partial [Chloroflexota bacterium]
MGKITTALLLPVQRRGWTEAVTDGRSHVPHEQHRMMLEITIQKQLRDFALNLTLTTSGGVTVLFGRSGAGKSMTLACVAGLAAPDKGRIVVNGRTYFDSIANINLPPQQRRVGYVTQDYLLFPHLTVAQNVAFGLVKHTRRERDAIVHEALSWLELTQLAQQR